MPLNLAPIHSAFAEPISRASRSSSRTPSHLVGLVATHREPFTPLVSALLSEAMTLAGNFGTRAERTSDQEGSIEDFYRATRPPY